MFCHFFDSRNTRETVDEWRLHLEHANVTLVARVGGDGMYFDPVLAWNNSHIVLQQKVCLENCMDECKSILYQQDKQRVS